MPALPAETSTLVSILLSGRMTPPPVTPPPLLHRDCGGDDPVAHGGAEIVVAGGKVGEAVDAVVAGRELAELVGALPKAYHRAVDRGAGLVLHGAGDALGLAPPGGQRDVLSGHLKGCPGLPELARMLPSGKGKAFLLKAALGQNQQAAAGRLQLLHTARGPLAAVKAHGIQRGRRVGNKVAANLPFGAAVGQAVIGICDLQPDLIAAGLGVGFSTSAPLLSL